MDYVYHYTDGEGALGIIFSRIIRASPKEDSAHGRGVYFTEIKPDADKFLLFKNNFEDKKQLVAADFNKIKYCFAIRKCDLEGLEKCSGGKRNVWLYPNDVVLEEVDFRFGPTDGEHAIRCSESDSD